MKRTFFLAHYRRRSGITLIELLVVISIIVVLASLTVAVVPGLQNRQRSASGAGQLQGWLQVAKQWALRDQAPRGVRLQPDPSTMLVTQLQYIEQPDDFFTGQLQSVQTDANGNGTAPAVAGTVDFTGGSADQTTWPVQPGDYLELNTVSPAKLFKIVTVTAGQLTIVGDVNFPSPGVTSNYRVVRQPRPRAGEGPLQFPADVAIDLNTNAWFNNPLPLNYPPGSPTSIDIMFAPSGEVIEGGSSSVIQLWVRDTLKDWDAGHTFPGDQVLVTIYKRTGMIGSQPIDMTLDGNPTPNYLNPYSFTQDGSAPGM